MRLGSMWRAVAVGLICVVAGACGGQSAVDDPAGDQPTTTTPPASPAPSTPPPTVARPEPVYVDGVPQVMATPTRSAAGTRVELEGFGFTGDPWQTPGGDLWLTDLREEGECVVLAQAENDLQVTSDGHLTGSFVVPSRGDCRFSTGEVILGIGHYRIAYQCTACHIGTLTMILPGESMEEPTGTRCEDTVVFAVQSFADEIHADGLACEEATSFVRDHARDWTPEDGPAQADAAGFSCDRTGRSEDSYPYLGRVNYRCTRGSDAISFTRQ